MTDPTAQCAPVPTTPPPHAVTRLATRTAPGHRFCCRGRPRWPRSRRAGQRPAPRGAPRSQPVTHRRHQAGTRRRRSRRRGATSRSSPGRPGRIRIRARPTGHTARRCRPVSHPLAARWTCQRPPRRRRVARHLLRAESSPSARRRVNISTPRGCPIRQRRRRRLASTPNQLPESPTAQPTSVRRRPCSRPRRRRGSPARQSPNPGR